jgi:hypothetical protein
MIRYVVLPGAILIACALAGLTTFFVDFFHD